MATLLSREGLSRYYELGGGRGVRPVHVEESARDRLWLEQLVQQVSESGSPRIELDVQGMHCAGCVWVIEELFSRQAGGQHILVNPALGRCELTVRPTFDLQRFVAEVEGFGYLMGPKTKTRTSDASLMLRTGVVAALAMNAMTFGIAQYLGLREEPLRGVVALLEVLLASAAVLIGAPVFVKAAWAGLRRGVLHLDLPIVVGLFTASVGTLLAYVRTGDASFADTLAVFVALMLGGRLIEHTSLERSRQRLLATRGTDGLFVRVVRAGRPQVIAASRLEAGMTMAIARGEVVPVDAVSDEVAIVSLDWVRGEASAVEVPAGETIPAGAIQRGDRVLQANAKTTLAASPIVRLIEAEGARTDERAAGGVFHRVSAVWVVSVLTAAVLTVLGYTMEGNLGAGLAAATALLVVTCPCAIGIATPLAFELATNDLRQGGVLVRRLSTLDRIRQVDHVVFDKTGTLTTGRLTLRDPGALRRLAPSEAQALAALVQASHHPKSSVVREALEAMGVRPPAIEAIEELPGRGLRGSIAGVEARLGAPSWAAAGHEVSAESDVVFTLGGRLVLELVTDEALRPGTRDELAWLESRGLRVSILSGDRAARVRRVAEALGLPPDRALGEASPEAKAAWLASNAPRALFVGDGINDALAVSAALVSATPSIERPFLPARTDFVFSHEGISPVRWVFAVSEQLQRVTRNNLAFAALYNVIGASLAIAGMFHPWVAAVLMPLSSLFVVGRTLRAFRASAREGLRHDTAAAAFRLLGAAHEEAA